MKISEVYKKYNIPENLQEHMYRVAAVGFIVAELLEKKIELDVDIIVTELLLHDMGNIVKFDFGPHIKFSEEETERLKKVRAEFIAKYGNEEHIATSKIAEELGVDIRVQELLEDCGSSKLAMAIDSTDWYAKICTYADLRVAPYGVVSVEERFNDVIKRYEGRDHALANREKTEKKKELGLILEQQIQEQSSSPLSLINDAMIAPIVKGFKNYNLI
jgi:5'-deoxynucleotidase YfbR-like HD superfamily hydrolase